MKIGLQILSIEINHLYVLIDATQAELCSILQRRADSA